MKLSMGEIPFLVSPKGLIRFPPAAQHSEPHPWLNGNDTSYWERSSFPGATMFSKMAFILNWLDAIFLACLIWHDYNLKQSVKEQKGAPVLAGSVPQKLLWKKVPPPPHWRVFHCCYCPLLAKWLAHVALGFVALHIFIPAGGSAALFINNVADRNCNSGHFGIQRQLWAWLQPWVAELSFRFGTGSK